MKKTPLILFFLILVSGYMSCDHDKLDTYSGQDDICFRYALATTPLTETPIKDSILNDSIIVRFGYDEIMKSDSIIKIKMQLLGNLKSYDRPINFIVDADSSTAKLGEDIELLHDRSIIYANNSVGYIYVKLKNTKKLENTMIVAELKTAPNEFFIAKHEETADKKINEDGKIKANRIRVFFDASFDMPNLWVDAKVRFDRLFGDYSKVKLDFICEILELDQSYFSYDTVAAQAEKLTPLDIFNSRFPAGAASGWKMLLENELRAYKEKHGEALIDENGEYVIIGKFDPKA